MRIDAGKFRGFNFRVFGRNSMKTRNFIPSRYAPPQSGYTLRMPTYEIPNWLNSGGKIIRWQMADRNNKKLKYTIIHQENKYMVGENK